MIFGKKDGDNAGGNGEREDVSSGLTMLHQAMLHTGTTLSETLDRGLDEVKKNNEAAHIRVAREISSMTKALQNTKDLLPLSYSGRDDATADELRRLGQLVEGMQAALADRSQTVTASAPVPVVVASGEYSGHNAAAADTVHAGTPLLNAVPEQRMDSATADVPPAAAEESAPAGDADKSAVPAAETRPEDGAGPEAGPEKEAPLTRDQVAEAVREVLAQELALLIAAPPRTETDDTSSAVADLGEQIAALRAEVANLAERLPPAQDDEEADGRERPVADADHSKVLEQAAGLSSAVLVCHRDLWELLSGWAGRHPHFRMPPHIADQSENRIAADISGRSLIAVLISLATLRRTATEGDGDRELASAVYQRISDSLASLSPDDGPLVTITLDDRAPRTHDSGDGGDSSAASPS
ncbi:hypothetical protein OG497_39510 [Streptomyces sp. NBC_01242]|uniref:hypothetical protein n=1 Tax=Streptomyces sp. NBC_01242 TaxID=2903795 RepID=UPI0022522A2F|nr:hypothetical protein [Streptomyces sp. NBC_01242]MCX4799932.1 hypothetical protein [Streptomyces sp. NBC_01242]